MTDDYDNMTRDELLFRLRDWQELAGIRERRITGLDAERDRLRAVVDAARHWYHFAGHDTPEADTDRATIALGEAVVRLEQLDGSADMGDEAGEAEPWDAAAGEKP